MLSTTVHTVSLYCKFGGERFPETVNCDRLLATLLLFNVDYFSKPPLEVMQRTGTPRGAAADAEHGDHLPSHHVQDRHQDVVSLGVQLV